MGGQRFGIHASNNGKIMSFAGGIPLKRDGKVVGLHWVSGGSVEQDHAVAEATQPLSDVPELNLVISYTQLIESLCMRSLGKIRLPSADTEVTELDQNPARLFAFDRGIAKDLLIQAA